MCCVIGKNLFTHIHCFIKCPAKSLFPNALPLLTYKSILPYIYIFVKLFFYILLKSFSFFAKENIKLIFTKEFMSILRQKQTRKKSVGSFLRFRSTVFCADSFRYSFAKIRANRAFFYNFLQSNWTSGNDFSAASLL